MPKVADREVEEALAEEQDLLEGLCHICHRRQAVWVYLPGTAQCCDQCVPRGCSCKAEPNDGNLANLDSDNWVQPVDAQGRKLPCCEWSRNDG